MADDEEYEDEYTDNSYEDENAGFDDDGDADFGDDADADADFEDHDFGDDADGFDEDGGDDWGDDDVDVTDQQYVIPIDDKPDEDSDEYQLDKDGNIVSPRAPLKRNKSVDIQCWTCSHCKAVNKLSWTLTKFAMKCCMCKQDTYTPTVKIFDSDKWEEPSNDFWECQACTLHNAFGLNECGACEAENKEYFQQSDDDTYGNNEFIKEEDSEEEDTGHSHSHMQGMGGRMGGMGGGDMASMMGSMFGGMGGMGGMGRMGMGMRGMHSHGQMHGQGQGQRQRQRRNRDTKPFNKKKENNLRNLLIIGFLRSCNGLILPTKFFDFFNLYYEAFDRWNFDLFGNDFTSIKLNLCRIKRTKKSESQWKNMYGLKHIKHNIKSDIKYPCKYEWTVRLLDRKQIELENATNMDISDINIGDDDRKKNEKKLESFEIQYMDVMVGVVNVNKMPTNQALSKAFNMYSCGHGMFAGNGKIFKWGDGNREWVRAMKALKHKDCVSVSIEWMERRDYNGMYGVKETGKSDKNIGNSNSNSHSRVEREDDIVVALTFRKNDERDVLRGASFCLSSSVAYKLAVSVAKKRFEIEWVKSGWVSQGSMSEEIEMNGMDIDTDDVKENL